MAQGRSTLPGANTAILVQSADLAANVRGRATQCAIPTVPTSAGTTEVLVVAPVAGTLSGVAFVFKDALAQHATNIVTFAVVNKGQAGAGTTAMLAATDANTTKTSTGTAISAYARRDATLHGTAANLAVAAGDVLAVQVTGSGTLANTLTEGAFLVTVTPS